MTSLRPLFPLAAAALLALPACTASEEKVMMMATQAQQLLEAGQPREAQILIQSALRKRDDLPAVYLIAAHIALATGRRGEAYQDYSNVLSLEATNPEALAGVAQTGLSSGHIDDSDRAADKILVLDPNQTEAMMVKGIIKMVRNDLDAASGFADRILAVKPDNIAGLILKSRVLALQGRRDEALTLIRGAIGKTGETLEMELSLAELQRGSGDAQGFLATVRRITTLAPKDREFRFDLIDTLYRLGRTDEARAAAATLLMGEPITSAEELGRFPRLWHAYDREAFTAEQLARAEKEMPVEARLMLGRYLIATGRAPAAISLLRPVATGWSGDVQGLYIRAFEAGGQVDQARAEAAKLLKTDPDNGDALIIRAHAAMARKDPTAAIIDLQRVARDYPGWDESYLELAGAYAAAGKGDSVRRVFEDGRKALPQNLPLARAYAQAMIGLKDNAAALDVARRFALGSTSSGAAWAFYAEICAKVGDQPCRAEASTGADNAKRRFGLDQVPGTPPPIALIGRLN